MSITFHNFDTSEILMSRQWHCPHFKMSGESLIFILMWWCNYEMQISFGVTLEHVVAIYTFLLYLDVVGALFRQGFLVVVCVVWGFLLVGCCVFSCFLVFFLRATGRGLWQTRSNSIDFRWEQIMINCPLAAPFTPLLLTCICEGRERHTHCAGRNMIRMGGDDLGFWDLEFKPRPCVKALL